MFHLGRIAANTFREAIREPVYFLMLAGALLIIGHYPWLTIFVFFEQLKLVVDGAMASTMLFSLAICVLCASSTVSREIRNGTVLLLLSKPISRWSFIFGKIAGIAAASLLFWFACSCASMVAVYVAVDQFRMNTVLYGVFIGLVAFSCVVGGVMNYLRGVAFSEYFTYAAVICVTGMMLYCLKFQPHPALSLADLGKALVLLAPAVLIMAVLAVGCSTRMDVVPVMCVCSVLFFLGLISAHLFRNGSGAVWGPVSSVLYALIPNWQYFWMADAMAVNRSIPVSYVWWCFGYALIYCVVGSVWAAVLFLNREAVGDNRN
jgi:ABC-type transport system involved in multi-copper enzyme maturation permease subunit